VRSLIVVALGLSLGACGLLDQSLSSGPSLNRNTVYLNPEDVISVSGRDTSRYACVGQPLLCVHRGVDFECRCP
jgi:hypothetical protein